MSTTIRFGAASGPCNVAAVKQAPLANESSDDQEDKGIGDPDKLLQCPFDKNHKIRTSRFPYHLMKCRKNHPKLASELRTCPFNARHLVPKHELTYHTETCEDRMSVDTEDGGSANGYCEWEVPVPDCVNHDTIEDWEKEADDTAAPFVWGVSTILNKKQGSQETRPSSHLGTSFRTPNTFPWSGST